MKNCYGKYKAENEDCQICTEGAECYKMPHCYKEFNKESEWCMKHCKHTINCSGDEVEADPITQLRILKNSGKISFKEMVEYGLPIVAENAKKNNKEEIKINHIQPVAPVAEKPKVDQSESAKQGRMDWIHK